MPKGRATEVRVPERGIKNERLLKAYAAEIERIETRTILDVAASEVAVAAADEFLDVTLRDPTVVGHVHLRSLQQAPVTSSGEGHSASA